MRLIFINPETNTEYEEQLMLLGDEVWQYEFGSANSNNPTHIWNGVAWKWTKPVKVVFEP